MKTLIVGHLSPETICILLGLGSLEYHFLDTQERVTPHPLTVNSIAPLEQVVLAPLADGGYGVFQFGRLVPESLRRLLADDADPSGFRVSVSDLVILLLL